MEERGEALKEKGGRELRNGAVFNEDKVKQVAVLVSGRVNARP